MLRKNSCIVFFLLLILLICNVVCAKSDERATRDKSRVLLVINNISDSKHSKGLNKIMHEELHKKIEVVYREEEAQKFTPRFKGVEHSDVPLMEVLDKIKDSKSDYFIYTELKPFNKKTSFNFWYHGKEVTATLALRIIDIKNKTELYASEYSISSKDSTDYFFVGSGSVSKKALRKVLFRAGEAISVHLPL